MNFAKALGKHKSMRGCFRSEVESSPGLHCRGSTQVAHQVGHQLLLGELSTEEAQAGGYPTVGKRSIKGGQAEKLSSFHPDG